MERNVTSRRAFVTAACGLSAAFHVLAEEPKPEIPAYNHLTDEQEIALGREIAEGLEKEHKLSFIEDSGVQEYVNSMFHRIAAASRRPNLPYLVKIVDTREVNACALPGGRVFLNRGLMEWAQNESQLTAVLGHEAGHVAGRHGANSLSRYAAADSLVTEASRVLFGDDRPARILKQAGGPVASFALLKFSRVQEAEADLLGYYNMQRAGWDPQGMLEVFHRFGEGGGIFDSMFSILQEHPDPATRERQIADEMKAFPPKSGLARDSEAFRAMQAAVKKLPRAKA